MNLTKHPIPKTQNLKPKKILITGGAGYIGSHTIVDLIENEFEVVSVDNLYNSKVSVFDGIEKITGVRVQNYDVDICDLNALEGVFEEHKDIVGVIHFAAYKSVGESVSEPLKYFQNNNGGLLNVLMCIERYKVPHLIFSSSCTVYGSPDVLPVTELTPQQEAESPYGRTKQMGEGMIKDYAVAHQDFSGILLRYFNPAGAHDSLLIGEDAKNVALNLVPVIMETAKGLREQMTVFGDDYDTRDGSCIRDYIHVMDLASAHTKSLIYLIERRNKENCEVFNVGIGEGVTVLEAINAFEKVSKLKVNYKIVGRRPGDIEKIYADNTKSERLLDWSPQKDIVDIMESAWGFATVNQVKV